MPQHSTFGCVSPNVQDQTRPGSTGTVQGCEAPTAFWSLWPCFPCSQIAFLRQQIAALRGENNALKAALSAEGRSLEDGVRGGSGPDSMVVEQLQSENSSLEGENTRLKMQLVRWGAKSSRRSDLDRVRVSQAAGSAR
jgi:hypothetical protein